MSVITELSDENDDNTDQNEVVYELDDFGYLIDEKGKRILDDNGNEILLSSEHIEYLKSTDMLEE